MGEVIKRVFGFILLVDNTHPQAQRAWRWSVTVAVLLFSIHIAIACNLLSFAGVSGFARSDDLETTRSSIDEVRVQQLETALFETRVKQCQSLKSQLSAQAYAQKIQDLRGKYAALTKQEYQLPQCSDL